MVVSFVNAGVLALSQAILVIMGANIGASFTTWIIALLGFLIDIKYVTYPLIAAGFILTMMKGQKRKVFGDVLLGFGLLFLGVSFIMSTFPSTGQLQGLAYRISELQTNNFLGVPMFMAIGCILAFGMQSTGAVTLTMVMLSCGWINFDLAAAMVLGENIGTTISANMAATDANIQAKKSSIGTYILQCFRRRACTYRIQTSDWPCRLHNDSIGDCSRHLGGSLRNSAFPYALQPVRHLHPRLVHQIHRETCHQMRTGI